MADKTHISWTDATWSPVTGCTKVSPGCENCYIERTPPFRMAHKRFDGDGIGATTGVMLHPERLEQPLKWRKPRRIFVCSMADLFHDDVPDEYIAQVWAVMALAPQHTFQVLTKRHARMRSLLTSVAFHIQVMLAVWERVDRPGIKMPLPNVWLGVSAEDQKRADLRIPKLLDTPSAVRFVSAEPLLGPVRLCHCVHPNFGGDGPEIDCPLHGAVKLDWLIVGGESGPKARPMHPDWARSLRNQCTTAGVAFHFKQWGAHIPRDHTYGLYGGMRDVTLAGDWSMFDPTRTDGAVTMVSFVKRHHGRELDGRTWDEYPAVRHG